MVALSPDRGPSDDVDLRRECFFIPIPIGIVVHREAVIDMWMEKSCGRDGIEGIGSSRGLVEIRHAVAVGIGLGIEGIDEFAIVRPFAKS